ncbi:MAG TPA: uracil-DNA glycosylase [Actinomycetes bacterium]|nr:uracil-DNA glycosylase [Actinomycetes bacterium]
MIEPGSGWPEDPATADTPVATNPAEVARLAETAAGDLAELSARISVCRACPRLVAWRERVAADRRRAFADQPYWGRPVPGWGDPHPRLLIVGLAPAAHGGNRTGRIFTGDRSGDWLFASLHRLGVAVQPTSEYAGDGQRLRGVRVVAAVRCAPPDNKPTTEERDTCQPWLRAEVEAVKDPVRAVVALGSYAWQATLRVLGQIGYRIPSPRPAFGHGATAELVAADRADQGSQDGQGGPAGNRTERRLLLVGSYHPSQQNTFTGKLTEPMLDAALRRATDYARLTQPGPASGG